jgi:hypothetical protein
VKRLARELKNLKEEVSKLLPNRCLQYDSLKIKQLTLHDTINNDPAKAKNDQNKLDALKKEIK